MNSFFWNLQDAIDRFVRRTYVALRYGKLTEHVMIIFGDGTPAEIEYRDSKGRIVGFWAYGDFDPDYPFQG